MERLKYSAVEWARACDESAARAERQRASRPRRQWLAPLLFGLLLAVLCVVPAMAAWGFFR